MEGVQMKRRDITACAYDECSKKNSCWRFIVGKNPHQHQAYAEFKQENGKCVFFIKVENESS